MHPPQLRVIVCAITEWFAQRHSVASGIECPHLQTGWVLTCTIAVFDEEFFLLEFLPCCHSEPGSSLFEVLMAEHRMGYRDDSLGLEFLTPTSGTR